MRKHDIPLATLAPLALAMALAVSAAAQTSTSNPPPPASSQGQSGQSQSGSTANTNQNRSGSQQDSDNPLNLTDDQKAKLRPIIADETQQMDAARNDASLTPDQKAEKINQIRQTASPKIRAVLTPEQLQKLAEMQQRAKQQQQQQNSTPRDSQKPPQ
jgi:periplasmic protein CpxP/Spy